MENDMNRIIEKFAKNQAKWKIIKKYLEGDIMATQEIIKDIDQKIKENEIKIMSLN